MYFTLNQAAKETGKSKATISRYLKNGRLSFVGKDENGYRIDPSELFRVFPKVEHETGNMEQTETPSKHNGNSELQTKVEMLEKLLEGKTAENEKLWRKLDEEAQERRKLTMILADHRQESPQKPSERPKRFFGIFSRSAA